MWCDFWHVPVITLSAALPNGVYTMKHVCRAVNKVIACYSLINGHPPAHHTVINVPFRSWYSSLDVDQHWEWEYGFNTDGILTLGFILAAIQGSCYQLLSNSNSTDLYMRAYFPQMQVMKSTKSPFYDQTCFYSWHVAGSWLKNRDAAVMGQRRMA